MMNQVWRRVQLMIAQGVGTLIGADFVQAKILDGETAERVKRIEPYGFSSHPLTGCQVYLAFPGGDRAVGLALVIGDKRYQMDLAEGEVALHDHEGNFVKIGTGGVITAKARTAVLADCPLFETTQNAKIGGNLEVVGTTQLTGLATATAGLTSPATVLAGTLASTSGSFGDVGAKLSALIAAHNGHTHMEQGDGNAVSQPNLKVT